MEYGCWLSRLFVQFFTLHRITQRVSWAKQAVPDELRYEAVVRRQVHAGMVHRQTGSSEQAKSSSVDAIAGINMQSPLIYKQTFF